MAQIIEQSDKFGKIGKAFGEGLGEQIPKEVDRYRLSQGLKNFEQDSQGLTPIQQLTRLSSIPGITPQMIQSFGDLAKQQNMRNAYTQPGGVNRGSIATGGTQGTMPQQQLNNIIQGQTRSQQRPEQQIADNVPADAMGQPQIVNKNPLRQEAIPKAPWSIERKNQTVGNYLANNPSMTVQEAQGMAADEEARDLAQPEAEQKIDNYLQQKQDQAKEKFTTQLETKLQKEGKEIFGDITGEMLNNLNRGMERELRTNPNATVDDVANKWTNKALDLAKTKKELETNAGKMGFDTFFKSEENLRNLKSAQKVFANSNNLEEFYNILRSSDTNGFSLSPQAAASIAYPRSKNVSEYISSVKPPVKWSEESLDKTARQHAIKIEDQLTSQDSLLAIAKDLKAKDPFFNQTAFFDQILEDADRIGLTERQKRELTTSVSDILPTWGDFFILPWFGGKK